MNVAIGLKLPRTFKPNDYDVKFYLLTKDEEFIQSLGSDIQPSEIKAPSIPIKLLYNEAVPPPFHPDAMLKFDLVLLKRLVEKVLFP